MIHTVHNILCVNPWKWSVQHCCWKCAGCRFTNFIQKKSCVVSTRSGSRQSIWKRSQKLHLHWWTCSTFSQEHPWCSVSTLCHVLYTLVGISEVRFFLLQIFNVRDIWRAMCWQLASKAETFVIVQEPTINRNYMYLLCYTTVTYLLCKLMQTRDMARCTNLSCTLPSVLSSYT